MTAAAQLQRDDSRTLKYHAQPGSLGELWEFRELFYFLAWRDIKVRYKQTALGVAWAISVDLFNMRP